MRIITYIFTCFILRTLAFGQAENQVTTEKDILPRNEIKQIFNDSIKNKFGINYNIFKVYKYADMTGKYYVVLTEKTDSVTPDNDTLSLKIKAFYFKTTANGLEKQWEINDLTIKQTNGNSDETSIWFWSKYCEFKDLNNDGMIDPVLVYGTAGKNGTDDGRIKILIIYKGQKNVVRHQNGVLDSDRNTQVDETFYSLPSPIQNYVKSLMQKMVDNGQAIFPYGWQEAMSNKKLKFDERH